MVFRPVLPFVVSTHGAEWLSTVVKVVSFDCTPRVLAEGGRDGQ